MGPHKQLFQFLKQLEQNNNRDWFAVHKELYAQQVRAPFRALVADLRAGLAARGIQIKDPPEKIMLRINRDLRFTRDKTPYHTVLKAVFVEQGRQSAQAGYYLVFHKHGLRVGGGLYMPAPPHLERIRAALLQNPEDLQKILRSAGFKKRFGTLQGDRAKRLKSAYRAAAQDNPLLTYKEFLAMAEVSQHDFLLSRSPRDLILNYFLAAQPLINFLNNA